MSVFLFHKHIFIFWRLKLGTLIDALETDSLLFPDDTLSLAFIFSILAIFAAVAYINTPKCETVKLYAYYY